MIGHKWEPAEGTIVNSHLEQMELPGKHGMHRFPVYEIDVRTPDGASDRARVPSADYLSLRPGTIVRLEINAKTGEIRLHPHEAHLIIGYSTSAAIADDDFARPASPAATAPGPAGLDVGQLFGGSVPAGAQMRVVGGTDAAEILRAVMSGDPAGRAAATEQLRHLRDAAGAMSPGDPSGQQASQVFFTSGDGSQPAGFGQGPAAVAAGTGPGSAGPGQPSPAARLAMLQEMADRGQLSQAEFDAKRQQILEEI